MKNTLSLQTEPFPHPSGTMSVFPKQKAVSVAAWMRHLAIDNWEQVAHFTQAVLAENGLSYREQEMHTGVGASTVYRMALGNAVGVRAVQQFAAFAAYGARREETKAFWEGTLSRFNPVDLESDADPPLAESGARVDTATPEEIAELYTQLLQPANRRAVTDLLRALKVSEEKK